ncbi:MAG TPA: glycosyltransferase family 39 protein [Thermoanaerobaculia bacterium]|nr:glycosyltransferase family 39 protein [Thermoanaerobaculia bacterium]
MVENRRLLLTVALVLLSAYSLAIRIWAGARGLDDRRYWDEHYSLDNVAALLDGSPHPANAFYPGLSYLPEAALLAAVDGVQRATGLPALRIRSADVPSPHHFTPLAFFLCRLLQACFGTASLVVLYRLARRHFGAAVGLAAALIMSAMPWHIRQSAIFKPDILLVLATVLALDWSIRALRRLGYRDFAWAGTWIGACGATKYNGVAVAVPLTLVAAAAAGSSRRWGFYGKRLALAAGLAAAIFVATNPYALLDPAWVRRDFGVTMKNYEDKGGEIQTSHWDMPASAVTALLSQSSHGPALGVVALCGIAAWVWRLLPLAPISHRTRGNRGAAAASAEILPLAVLASFPLAYVAMYALITNNPSEHNWLPLAPVTSLAAADLLVRGARLARARLHSPPHFAGAWKIAAGAFVVYLSYTSFSYARTLATPTTWSLTEDYLREALQPRLADRVVYVEDSDEAGLVLGDGRRRTALAFFPAAEKPADGTLETGDAEVLVGGRQAHAARCRPGAEGGAALNRCADFAPTLLRSRGEALTVVLHPRKPVGEPSTLAPAGPRCAFRLAGALSPAALLGSLQVVVDKDQAAVPESVDVGPLSLPLLPAGLAHGSRFFSSPRFPLRQLGPATVRVRQRPCQLQEVLLLEWQ